MMIADRFVAVCDVLGFRDMVRRTSLPELTRKYARVLRRAKSFIPTCVVADRTSSRLFRDVRHAVFSDSIIVWTDRAPGFGVADSFFSYLSTLMGVALVDGFPLRIGVAFGPCAFRSSRGVFLGTALVDAKAVSARRFDLLSANARHFIDAVRVARAAPQPG